MTDIARLEVQLDLDDGRFSTRIREAGEGTAAFGKTVNRSSRDLKGMERELDTLSQSASRLKMALGGLVGLKFAKDMFSGFLESQKAMQRIEFGLQGALGSARAAGEAYEYVADVSQRLGLNLEVTAQEFMKLTAAATAMNVPMEEQKRLFEGLSRSATVLHLTSDQVKFATMALSQMFGKGKIQAEELRRQLGEHVPGVVPRFQKAVLKMTEGTDLAGKSFDQLLQMGALATDKFLPALSDALEETGAGAELAAKGINANLNRLSTEWFKFRAEATKGLFAEAVSGGAALLAENMERVANTAMAAAAALVAVKAAQFAGRGMNDLTNRGQDAVKVRREAAQRVQANLTVQRSIQAKTQARLNDLKAQQTELASARSAIVQAHAQAKAEAAIAAQKLATAKARGAKFGATRSSVMIENQLTGALIRQKAAAADMARLREREIALTNALTGAKGRLAQVTDRVTAAQRRQQAMGFLPGLTRGLKAAGSSLMALAGGPWGVALLAVGALGVALFNAKRRAKEAEEAFNAQIKTTRDLSVSLQDMADSHEGLNRMSFSPAEMVAGFAEAARQLREIADERKRLVDEIAKNEKRLTLANSDMNGHMGRAMELSAKGLSEEIETSLDRIKEIDAEAPKLSAQFERMKSTLQDSLSPEHFQAIIEKMAELGEGAGLEELRAALTDAERAALDVSLAIQGIQRSLEDGLESRKLSNIKAEYGEAAAFMIEENRKLERIMADAAAKGETVSEADQRKWADLMLAHADEIQKGEQLRLSRQALAKAQREAETADRARENSLKSLSDRMDRQIESNKEFLETDEKLSPTRRMLLRIEQEMNAVKGIATQREMDLLEQKRQTLMAQDEDIKQKERLIALDQRMNNLTTEIDAERVGVSEQNEDERLNLGRGDRAAEQARREVAIYRTYQRRLRDLSKQNLKHDDDVYIQQRAKIEEQHQWRIQEELAHQQELELARQDWTGGMRRGWENFRDSAMNAAEMTANVTGDLLTGLTNAMVDFATTGKASFSDLTRHILTEITRMLMSRALAQLVDVMMGMFGWGGQTQGYTSGGSTMMAGSPSYSTAHYSANGNVMTAAGPAKLNYYENGGVARSPQISVFGEGRMPEAYVPLPDGRSIPVTMKGDSGGGGGGVSNHTQITVAVNQDGSATADAQSTDSDARQLGKLIEMGVRTVLATEMRQGGLLWRMQHGTA